MRNFILAILTFGCLHITSPLLAQQDSSGDTARLRVFPLVVDVPALEVYVDGELFSFIEETTELRLYYGYSFVNFDPGTYSIAFTPAGEPLEEAILTEDVTLEAGHDYSIALFGTVEADDVQALVVDETTLLADVDPEAESPAILVNALRGPDALTALLDGEVIADSIPYGESAIAIEPPFENLNLTFVDADDAEQVVFDFPGNSPPASATFFVLVGDFPGQMGLTYLPITATRFRGTVTIVDGGEISVGDRVDVPLEHGSRMQFTLTLEEATTLDIALASQNAEPPVVHDAYLRIYDEAGELIAENDELSFYDDLTGDAGLNDLELEAGAYIIEAAAFADALGGTFSLSVVETE